jgi:hypothetical protein
LGERSTVIYFCRMCIRKGTNTVRSERILQHWTLDEGFDHN